MLIYSPWYAQFLHCHIKAAARNSQYDDFLKNAPKGLYFVKKFGRIIYSMQEQFMEEINYAN